MNHQSRKKERGGPAGKEKAFFNREVQTGKPAVVRRILTKIDGDVAATGNVLGYFINSVGAPNANEWSSFAGVYEEYRVRAVRVKLCPLLQTTVVSPPTAAAYTSAYPGPIGSANYAGGVASTTLNALVGSDGSRVHGCNAQVMEQLVTWDLNPSAKLWTPIGTNIAALSQIGCEYIGSVVAAVAINGATTHIAFVEYDVEFRGRG
jgi:hypothetical protein